MMRRRPRPKEFSTFTAVSIDIDNRDIAAWEGAGGS
jgi:hypothetical protein